MQTLEQLQAENQRLRTENAKLRICATFGILTRQALELEQIEWTNSAIIFCDLDDLKQLNTAWGSEIVDLKIRSALSQVRSSEMLSARYYSGDEFVFITPADQADRAAHRILRAFKEQGISGTFSIVRCLSGDLLEACSTAKWLVERQKKQGQKGGVLSLV